MVIVAGSGMRMPMIRSSGRKVTSFAPLTKICQPLAVPPLATVGVPMKKPWFACPAPPVFDDRGDVEVHHFGVVHARRGDRGMPIVPAVCSSEVSLTVGSPLRSKLA